MRPGTPDASFGDHGITWIDLPHDDSAYDAVVQPDGKTVAVGWSEQLHIAPYDAGVYVARFNANGKRDRTFAGGTIRLPLPGLNYPAAICLGRDGSIFIAATSTPPDPNNGSDVANLAETIAVGADRYAVVKIRKDGRLDPSFGTSGIAWSQPLSTTPRYDIAFDMALAPDGGPIVLWISGIVASTILMSKLTPGGLPDMSFGVDGTAEALYAGVFPGPSRLAVQPDGRILVASTLNEVYTAEDLNAATTSPANPPGSAIVIRYLPTGEIDPTFGSEGIATAPNRTPDTLWGMRLAPDGKILLFGLAGWGGGVARLNPGGSADGSFGNGGSVAIQVTDATSIRDAIPLPDGRVFVGVNAYGQGRGFGKYIARLSRNGKPDPSFGRRGYALIPSLSIFHRAALQSRRVLAIGAMGGDPDRFTIVALRR